MKEEFLHYLWKYCLYDKDSLVDNDNVKISVLNPGEYNRDSGPDFFNARIRIGDTEWAGNVEIHTRSSHFIAHGHNTDHAFDNVILHVVAEDDRKVFNANGEELLTVRINFDHGYYYKYLDLVNNPCTIACGSGIRKLETFLIRHWLHSLLIERLQMKSEGVMRIFSETGNDWDETFYRMLSRYFGFRVNTEPFELLASALPFRIIARHSDNLFQVEAMLFGTAGLLDEGLFRDAIEDQYYRDLIREFRVLSAKYKLKSIHGWLWKFSRLRPVNFPTIRISQLASMLTSAGGLFSRIIEATDLEQIRELFNASASEYWDNHFVFGRESRKIIKNTGDQASDIFLINAVIPVIFAYCKFRDNQVSCERALDFLENIGPESNAVIREWSNAGVVSESAFYTQALLQLTDEYCRKRRCIECRIGCKLISMGNNLRNHDELLLEPDV